MEICSYWRQCHSSLHQRLRSVSTYKSKEKKAHVLRRWSYLGWCMFIGVSWLRLILRPPLKTPNRNLYVLFESMYSHCSLFLFGACLSAQSYLFPLFPHRFALSFFPLQCRYRLAEDPVLRKAIGESPLMGINLSLDQPGKIRVGDVVYAGQL